MHPYYSCTVPKNNPNDCDCMSICKLATDNLRILVGSYHATCSNIISQLTSANYVMLLNDTTTMVGRTIGMVTAQIFPAGTSKQISRNHFTIAYNSDGNFTLQCLSKNGIMIDEKFYYKREQPYILPQHCIIRFPSTQDVIHFRSLINEKITYLEANNEDICSYRSTVDSQVNVTSSPNASNSLDPFTSNEETLKHPSSARRPPYSYSQLIIQAISASPQKKLPLCKIYSFIMEKYPYYREFAIKSWQNSIRHNLSMKSYFLKTPQSEPNIGHLWMLRPSCEAQLVGKRFLVRGNRPQAKKVESTSTL